MQDLSTLITEESAAKPKGFAALCVRTHKPKGKSAGFTLVEVMVAMSIFSVLVTMGMQAVYAAITQHRQTQDVRTVMDSLNFVMEDMARNLRTATNIHCVYPTDPIPPTWLLAPGTWYSSTNYDVVPQSCITSGSNLIFFNGIQHNGTNGDFVTYNITGPHDGTPNVVEKLRGESLADVQVVTPPEVTMDATKSGFLVRGAEHGGGTVSGDNGQPTVVIRLAGTIKTGAVTTPFAIETMVSLRSLDN